MGRQAELKGVESPPEIREINDAAEEYVEARDKRQAFLRTEVAKRTVVHDLLKKHKLKQYRYADKIVEIVPEGEKFKVRSTKPRGKSGKRSRKS